MATVEEARRIAKQKAYEEIIAMALPVADWPEMEEQIEKARIEYQDPQ